ncbi:MAG: amidohydrolase [Lentisphaerae bacterium]|nr:amidohydrolase [Lentisphaerota bacterium]
MRSKEGVKQAVLQEISARQEQLLAVAEKLWQQPETGYREVRSAAYAAEILQTLGLEVRTGLALTGFRADWDSGRPGPTVAVLGEMDALLLPSHPAADPQTGAVHACGHHAHLTTMLGVAMGLLGAVKGEELSGRVAFVGTPAEEGIELDYRLGLLRSGKIQAIMGKAALIREGVFSDIDIALMNHVGEYPFCVADFNGTIKKKIIFRGRSCHASTPHKGINALNAVNLALHAVALLRESYGNDDRIRMHGIISHGGDAVNIVPDHVTLEYQLRADTLPKLRSLNARFDRAMVHCALALDAQVEITSLPTAMPLRNDDELARMFAAAVAEVVPGTEVQVKQSFNPGCTDMGDLSQIMPVLHGGVPGAGAWHSIDFAIHDPGLAIIANAQVLALMLVELLYGDASCGRAVAAGKSSCLPLADYLAQVDSLGEVVHSEDCKRL